MNLRSASVDDVEALFDIRCSVRENHQSREELAALGIVPATIAEMITSGDYLTFIADEQGWPAGFAMAQISEGYVFACFVKPEFERRGIGRALMNGLEDGLRRAGLKEAWLLTGADQKLRAVGFYRHLGWREGGFLDDGQIRFVKSL